VSSRIEDLAPDVQAAARTFLSLIQTPYVVTSTLRTQDEQVALYAQGRKSLGEVNALRVKAGMRAIAEAENKYTVTRADGVKFKSNHQGGRAMDVVPAGTNGNPVWPPASDGRWQIIAKAGKEAGFKWGGDWAVYPDLPHWEMEAT
jgi:peptidoglycan LD-endopeptidase CwlK